MQLSDQLQIRFTSLSCSIEGHLLLLFFLRDVKENKTTKVNSVREHDPCGPAPVHVLRHREITAVINKHEEDCWLCGPKQTVIHHVISPSALRSVCFSGAAVTTFNTPAVEVYRLRWLFHREVVSSKRAQSLLAATLNCVKHDALLSGTHRKLD